ncbi:helix-turn-helix transcriptional regulator [Micromonospora sp. DSM 115977]|uniref:Helix-turn-helix transcriptional regulator n=1 Tax=Micromonospora reichwaldensis TaxID=3075516 RepID=A0ABU2WZS3_9ACTN|nr:helix-turn-helix transcriptional regulator [Micromonospora sp. DSM 115977]MDT0530876.1 helix-turn-helix transcriptional regulator [Micromonospora sp. DSM 115977]
MTGLPVGRRVAQWRVRRNMTQQQFADRLGKSKSWVDKVERGVRPLERMSNLREVAEALRIDLEVLLAERIGQPDVAVAGVARVRAALARYHVEASSRPPDVATVRARLDHAEQSYRHARYPILLGLLPGLLDAAREARVARPGRAADELLVSAYGLVALVLVKVGQGELAWLAADRGMAVALATDDARLAAVATVPLSQALRAVGRRRSAMETALVAARRLPPREPAEGALSPGGDGAPSLRVTLLLQAALAAAGRGDEHRVAGLLGQAAAAVGTVGGFGRASVEAARVVAEAAVGDVQATTVRHERLVCGEQWRWLPPEHRAAYLLDVARVHALAGDMVRAGRALLDAERTAHSEVHDRPAVRDLVATVARYAAAPAGLARLAAALHVT